MMKIDDWEYHIRMLNDIAKRNGGVFIAYYDPQPDKLGNEILRATTGLGSSIVPALCTIIDFVAESSHVKPSELVDVVSIMVKVHEGEFEGGFEGGLP